MGGGFFLKWKLNIIESYDRGGIAKGVALISDLEFNHMV